MVDALALAVGAGARTLDAARQTLALVQPVQPILLFPPWAEIYRTDAERDQTFTDAVTSYEGMLRFLDRMRLEGLEVPIGPAEARADFIEAVIRYGPLIRSRSMVRTRWSALGDPHRWSLLSDPHSGSAFGVCTRWPELGIHDDRPAVHRPRTETRRSS